MKKLFGKIKEKALGVQMALRGFMLDERGDTNFISIAIILVVIIALAIVFIGFRDQIIAKLQEAIGDLMDAF